MYLTINKGVAREINPHIEGKAFKAFERSVVKFRALKEDGATLYPDTKKIDAQEFTKVFRRGFKHPVLVAKKKEDPALGSEGINDPLGAATPWEHETLLRRVWLMLSVHPENEPNSEFADMIQSIEDALAKVKSSLLEPLED